jgi:pimeloyl-ACP methyl ester carboxylesterase
MIETDWMRPARRRAPAASLAVSATALMCITLGCGAGETGGKSLLDLATAAEIVDGERCRVHVVLFRGLLDQPSAGLNDLANELRSAGMTAVAQPYTTWEAALAEIETLLTAETPPQLVFMGHSYGADSAVLLAQELGRRGIGVDLLFLIDATVPPPIPANVARCVQVYNPNDFAEAAPDVFPGNPVQAAPGNDRTQIINLRARVEDLGPDAASIDVAAGLLVHLTLDSEPVVHRLAREETTTLCAPPAKP